MKARIQRVIVIILVGLLTFNTMPGSILVSFAAQTIYSGNTVDISDVAEEDYTLVGSGGTVLNILSGGSLTGTVSMGGDSANNQEFNIEQGAVLNGNVDIDIAYFFEDSKFVTITNSGTINGTVNMAGGTVMYNYGSTSAINAAGRLYLDGGSVDTLNITDGYTYINNGATIGTLEATGGVVTVEGEGTVSNLTCTSQISSDNPVTLNVTGSVNVGGTVNNVSFNVSDSTTITTQSDIQVVHDSVTYIVPAGTTDSTVGELYGYEMSSTNVSFEDVYVGYDDIQAKTVSVTNTKALDIDVDFGNVAENFDISATKAGVAVDLAGITLSQSETMDIVITPKMDLEAGTYDETINLTVMGMSETIDISFTVNEKLQGEASISMEDFYYGMTGITPLYTSTTNGTDNVIIEYKSKGQADSLYTTTVPTEVGSYVVRATFPETDEYNQVIVTDEYTISYLSAPENPVTISGTAGNAPYYVSNVTIYSKEGYLISEAIDGSYGSYLTYGTSRDSVLLYFKDTETGAISDGYKTEGFLIDYTAPVISNAEDGGVYYGSSISITVNDTTLKYVYINGRQNSYSNDETTIKLPSNNGVEVYNIVAEDAAGNKTEMKITVAGSWMKSGVIPSGSLVRLSANNPYTLGDGNWNVSGDSTSYVGGNTFYVGSDGDYTFTKE